MDGTIDGRDAVGSAEATARLLPRRPTPGLRVPILGGGVWDLDAQQPDHFTMIVAYRGYHCPVCTTYLRELDRLLPEFSSRGVNVVAVSSDSKERAALAQSKW